MSSGLLGGSTGGTGVVDGLPSSGASVETSMALAVALEDDNAIFFFGSLRALIVVGVFELELGSSAIFGVSGNIKVPDGTCLAGGAGAIADGVSSSESIFGVSGSNRVPDGVAWS